MARHSRAGLRVAVGLDQGGLERKRRCRITVPSDAPIYYLGVYPPPLLDQRRGGAVWLWIGSLWDPKETDPDVVAHPIFESWRQPRWFDPNGNELPAELINLETFAPEVDAYLHAACRAGAVALAHGLAGFVNCWALPFEEPALFWTVLVYQVAVQNQWTDFDDNGVCLFDPYLISLSTLAQLAEAIEKKTASVPRPYSERRSGRDKAPILNDSVTWITISQAASLSGVGKGIISRAASAGQIRTNGKTLRQRRLHSADFNRWNLQRLQKPEREETDDYIRRQLSRVG